MREGRKSPSGWRLPTVGRVGPFPRPSRTRTHDPFPDTPKGLVFFDWEHKVEIINQILRMTLGLKDHPGSSVAEPGLVPEYSLHSSGVTTEIRYIYKFRNRAT